VNEDPWFRDPVWAYWNLRGGPTRFDRWLVAKPVAISLGAAGIVAVVGIVPVLLMLRSGSSVRSAEAVTVWVLLVPFAYWFVRQYTRRITALIRRWNVEH